MIVIEGFKPQPGIQSQGGSIIGHHLQIYLIGLVRLAPMGQGVNESGCGSLAAIAGLCDQAE